MIRQIGHFAIILLFVVLAVRACGADERETAPRGGQNQPAPSQQLYGP